MSATPTQKSSVFEQVLRIPLGRVTTFGCIGKTTGINPRVVGWILSGMNDEEMSVYPWQRVVAKDGIISALKLGFKGELQIQLLEKEGTLCENGRIIDYEGCYWE